MLAPIGYYYEPKHDSERGYGEGPVFPGEEGGVHNEGQRHSLGVFACHVIAVDRRPARAPVLRDPKHDPRRGEVPSGEDRTVNALSGKGIGESERCVISYGILGDHTTLRCSCT